MFHAPAQRRVRHGPHRLWLPLVVGALLAPWMVTTPDRAPRPVLVVAGGSAAEMWVPPSPRPAAAAVEKVTRTGDRPPNVILSPAEPLPAGSPPADELAGHRAIGQVATARLGLDLRSLLPDWRVEFRPPNGALRGRTDGDQRLIEIFVHTDDVFTVARVLAHEIGHAIDLTRNDTASRRDWKARRGMSVDTPWWPEPGAHDFDTGAGDFAECAADAILGVESRSSYGPCQDADKELVLALLEAG